MKYPGRNRAAESSARPAQRVRLQRPREVEQRPREDRHRHSVLVGEALDHRVAALMHHDAFPHRLLAVRCGDLEHPRGIAKPVEAPEPRGAAVRHHRPLRQAQTEGQRSRWWNVGAVPRTRYTPWKVPWNSPQARRRSIAEDDSPASSACARVTSPSCARLTASRRARMSRSPIGGDEDMRG